MHVNDISKYASHDNKLCRYDRYQDEHKTVKISANFVNKPHKF